MFVKYTAFYLFLLSQLWSDVYYAKAEPLKKHIIKSNVTGKVVFANESIEGSLAGATSIILIDARVDRIEKQRLSSKVSLLTDSVKHYQAVYEKRFHYYKSIKKLSSKSKTSKDNAFYTQASAKQSLNSAKIELANSKQALYTLNKQIREKQISFKNWYVYDLHVLEGDYVTLGTPLLTVADISKVKLTLFLSAYDASHAHDMDLYVNDIKSEVKLNQIWKMSDSEHLSSYEATLILPALPQLSQLLKIELKGY